MASWYVNSHVHTCNDHGELFSLTHRTKPGKPRKHEGNISEAPCQVATADAHIDGLKVVAGTRHVPASHIASPATYHLTVAGKKEPHAWDKEISAVRLSPSGRYVAIGDKSGALAILEVDTLTEKYRSTSAFEDPAPPDLVSPPTPPQSSPPIHFFAWASDETRLTFSAPGSDKIGIWDERTNTHYPVDAPGAVSVEVVRAQIMIVRTIQGSEYKLVPAFLNGRTLQFGKAFDDGRNVSLSDMDRIALNHNAKLLATYSSSKRQLNVWKIG